MGNPLSGATNVFTDFAKELADTISTNFDVESIQRKLAEVDESAMAITNSFGLGRDNIVELKGAMTAAVTEVTLLGGSFQSIADIQKGVGEALGRNLILASESYEKIFATEKITGQATSTMLPKLKEVGVSTYQMGAEMQKVVNSAREIGVNVKEVSEAVVKNMDKVNMYNFDGGIEGLAKMAAHATSIGISMESTFKTAEKAFNPEGAIKMASELQMLGVTQSQLLDPLKLMDLSANDPEELQRQMAEMSKSFVELNEKGRLQIAPGAKRRMREIAEAMGLSYNELAKMSIGAAELDDKMQKIKFPDAIKEEDRQFIANMAEMNEQGEYVIQYKGEAVEVNKLMDKFQGDQKAFQDFMKESEPKTVEELAKEQLSVTKSMEKSLEALANRTGYAVAGSDMGEKMIEAAKLSYDKVTDLAKGFDIKGIKEQYQTGMTDVLNTLTNTLTGEGSIEDVFISLSNAATGTKNFLEGGFKQSLESAMSTANLIHTSNNEIIRLFDASTRGIINAGAQAEGFSEGNVVDPGRTSQTTNSVMNPDVNNALTTMNTTNTSAFTARDVQTVSHDGKVDIHVTLDAPPNVDTAQLMKSLTDQNFLMALDKALKQINSNYGQTNGGEKK